MVLISNLGLITVISAAQIYECVEKWRVGGISARFLLKDAAPINWEKAPCAMQV